MMKKIGLIFVMLVTFISHNNSIAQYTQQGNKLVTMGVMGQILFGQSVAISADGNTAIIGGPYDNNMYGASWIFIRSGETWTQQGNKLTGNDTISNFAMQGNS